MPFFSILKSAQIGAAAFGQAECGYSFQDKIFNPAFLAIFAFAALVAILVHRIDVGFDALDFRLGIQPAVAGGKVPARLFYDINERQTNTSIPLPSAQPTRNANDPANATDPTGAVCRAQ